MEPQTHGTPAGHEGGHDDHFKAYIAVFILLCVFTAVSFVVNYFLGETQPMLSMWIILAVAVVKALCVAVIFMHLRQDWGNVYFIIVPVCIMGVMMIIVFLPDIVLAWHNIPYE
jgi:caa(3)-type oxidase subunit IV